MFGQPLLAVVAVLFVFHRLLDVDDVPPRHQAQERGVGARELESDGLQVVHHDVLGLEEVRVHPGRSLVQLERAFERGLHGGGVDGVAVLEAGARVELEGPFRGVGVGRPRGREPGLEFGRIAFVLEQRVVGGLLDGADGQVVFLRRVHHGDGLLASDDEDALAVGGFERMRGHRRAGDGRCQKKGAEALPHWCFPLYIACRSVPEAVARYLQMHQATANKYEECGT